MNEDKDHALGIMVKVAHKPHRNASRVTDRAKNYMLLLDDINDVDATLKMWKRLPTWNPLATTLVVFMEPLADVKVKNQLVREAFVKLFSEGIIYANALYQLTENSLKLEVETWFPYQDDGCAKKVGKIHKIDECIVPPYDDTKELSIKTMNEFNTEMFPKLPDSLHQCVMKASTYVWEPFVVGNITHIESGLEVIMLKTILGQMDMKVDFKILRKEVVTRKITNDNETGIYADLIQK